jgi:CDGSH-type Zn-finger protein
MSESLEVRCRENGPYVIKGPVRVLDHLGNEFAIPPGKDAVALCRCGQSKNRPFCDGSHRTCGFNAPERGLASTGPMPSAGPPPSGA